MNQHAACPVNYKKVNVYLIKFYSALVASFLIMYLTADWKGPIYVLAVDYFLRVVLGIRFSFICHLLNGTMRYLGIEPKEIDASAKAFAARVGLGFTWLLALSILFNWNLTAKITAAVFLIAVLLEVIFSFCLACQLESLWRKFNHKNHKENQGIFE